MPVDFLTDEQAARYGRFTGPLSAEQLHGCFHLDNRDRQLLERCRGDHNRLGMAVELGTVRFLGTFLRDWSAVPGDVVTYIAEQLKLDPELVERYRGGERRWEHRAHIREAYGFREFAGSERFRLARWLYARAWATPERLTVLFDLATARLVERRVILPGVSVMTKLVARIAERANLRAWRRLTECVDVSTRERLEALLEVPEGKRRSLLDRFDGRRPASRQVRS